VAAKEAVEAWNIATRYLPESDSYPRVTAENIPESLGKNLNVFNDLVCYRNGTENPRVGGSIPPLATIPAQFNNLALHSCLSWAPDNRIRHPWFEAAHRLSAVFT
jgi:hypothetical protein